MKQDQFQAAKQFLAWMESRYPGSARRIVERAKVPIAAMALQGLCPSVQGLPPSNGLGQFPGIPPLPTAGGTPVWSPAATLQPTATPEPEPDWWEKIAGAAADVAKGYLSYKQQDKITDMQVERMKRGMPPIEDPGRYMAPTVKVAHDIDPAQLRRAITPSAETQNLLMIGGLLIGGVLLLSMGRR